MRTPLIIVGIVLVAGCDEPAAPDPIDGLVRGMTVDAARAHLTASDIPFESDVERVYFDAPPPPPSRPGEVAPPTEPTPSIGFVHTSTTVLVARPRDGRHVVVHFTGWPETLDAIRITHPVRADRAAALADLEAVGRRLGTAPSDVGLGIWAIEDARGRHTAEITAGPLGYALAENIRP